MAHVDSKYCRSSGAEDKNEDRGVQGTLYVPGSA